MTENILILTPYHDFGEMLRLGLAESQTYFPYLAHNSAEALLVASQEKFKLAIIDTEIPGPSFHDLWNDIKTMQPDMQLVLIFPEAEDEYPSLNGIAPLGCVDHLLYMPEFLELIDSAFPSVEEIISPPATEQGSLNPTRQEKAQPEQQQKFNTAWLEDPQIASEHLEKQLPVCDAKAAMIARFDKVLAYSDQLEVSAAQEIANRFTRYWDKDSKNSDLVRFIHLGPMNNPYLLYVTALVNEAVLAALYQPDTPLSRPHREISKLAHMLLNEAPSVPHKDTGPLEMDFVHSADDVYSQRMRMVTGSLNPLALADTNEVPAGKDLVEQEEDEELEDMDDEAFDPEQFHLEDLLSRMPSPDPETSEPTDPIEIHPAPNITQNAVENLRLSWDSDNSVADDPARPTRKAMERNPYPWETDGSLDIPETPAKNIEETQPSRQESHTGLDAEEREPYPWELEASSFDEPAAPTEDTAENLSFPWELEPGSTTESEKSIQDTAKNLSSPWSDTGSLDALSFSELDQPDEKPQKVNPFTPQDAVENLRYPWESDTSIPDDLSSSELDQPGEKPQKTAPFISQDIPYPREAGVSSLDELSSSELDQPDEEHQKMEPPSQGGVENQRKAWETHTAHLTPPPPKETDQPAESIQDAVESLRNPWESNTGSLTEQPPNGHEEFNEDDFEPLPDFTDLESASESPLSNGWHREENTQPVATAAGENKDSQSKTGTTPLKRPATRAQQESEEQDDEYADCVYTYTTFVTPLLKRHALTRELAQILAKSMTAVCEKNHWKLLNMTARPSGMLWTARIPPNVTTGQMVKIVREETSDMLYEIHPRLKYEALSENFWAANYLVVSGSDAPDDNSIKEFLQRIHQTYRSNGSRH